MLKKLRQKRAGFTLVEIMIVVAIIALLAAIAVPNFLRSRKRSQATRILEDLRMIDSAVDQYAIESGLAGGTDVSLDQVKLYIKKGTSLYETGKSILGGDYSLATYKVDGTIGTPTGTKDALSDVAPDEFWSPYTLQ
ncbi:MAG: epsG [Chthoniobacteraceae bacterium]|nr:epsG [Chthoniobacteraceae bacterium]